MFFGVTHCLPHHTRHSIKAGERFSQVFFHDFTKDVLAEFHIPAFSFLLGSIAS
jgi:hypothetical protein